MEIPSEEIIKYSGFTPMNNEEWTWYKYDTNSISYAPGKLAVHTFTSTPNTNPELAIIEAHIGGPLSSSPPSDFHWQVVKFWVFDFDETGITYSHTAHHVFQMSARDIEVVSSTPIGNNKALVVFNRGTSHNPLNNLGSIYFKTMDTHCYAIVVDFSTSQQAQMSASEPLLLSGRTYDESASQAGGVPGNVDDALSVDVSAPVNIGNDKVRVFIEEKGISSYYSGNSGRRRDDFVAQPRAKEIVIDVSGTNPTIHSTTEFTLNGSSEYVFRFNLMQLQIGDHLLSATNNYYRDNVPGFSDVSYDPSNYVCSVSGYEPLVIMDFEPNMSHFGSSQDINGKDYMLGMYPDGYSFSQPFAGEIQLSKVPVLGTTYPDIKVGVPHPMSQEFAPGEEPYLARSARFLKSGNSGVALTAYWGNPGWGFSYQNSIEIYATIFNKSGESYSFEDPVLIWEAPANAVNSEGTFFGDSSLGPYLDAQGNQVVMFPGSVDLYDESWNVVSGGGYGVAYVAVGESSPVVGSPASEPLRVITRTSNQSPNAPRVGPNTYW